MIGFTIVVLCYALLFTYQLMIAKNDVEVDSLRLINNIWFGKIEGILFKLISMWTLTIIMYILKPHYYIKVFSTLRNLVNTIQQI